MNSKDSIFMMLPFVLKTSLNSAAWIFNMKNRFKDEWKDKHENEFSGSIGTVIMPTPLDEDLQEND